METIESMVIKHLNQPDIGNIIKEIRQELNLSQEKFASKLGVSFSSLNRWENHKVMPFVTPADPLKHPLQSPHKSRSPIAT